MSSLYFGYISDDIMKYNMKSIFFPHTDSYEQSIFTFIMQQLDKQAKVLISINFIKWYYNIISAIVLNNSS